MTAALRVMHGTPRAPQIVATPKRRRAVTPDLSPPDAVYDADIAIDEAGDERLCDLRDAQTHLALLRPQRADLERLRGLAAGDACPVCEQAMCGDTFAAFLDFVELQIDGVTADGQYFTARLKAIARRMAEADVDACGLDDR